MRVADRDDELADAQRGGVAELGRRVRLALGAQDREVGERVRADHARLDLAAVGERGANARAPRRLSTTWAEVSMKPSGVITTPEPPPRRATRRLATDGASCLATRITACE